MKHICFFTLSLRRGGAERVLVNLCNECFVRDYKVTIITCINETPEYEMDSRIEHIAIDKKDTSYANIGERFYKRRKILKGILSKVCPDYFISFLPEPNFLILSLRGKITCPIIISVRNDPKVEYRSMVWNMIMKVLYPKADGYVLQTEEAREYFSFSNKIYKQAAVIPNAISRQFLNQKRIEVRKKIMVTVGRLDKQKNQQLLIRAFSKILPKYKDYVLHIYGEGPLRDVLEEQIAELGLNTNVILCGKVNNLSDYIKDAAMFVLTSDYEGMPNALMEAMALGIPVISTDCPCGGPKFLIKDGENGILIPKADEGELVKAIEYLLQNETKANQMGTRAMEIAVQLSPQVIHEKWKTYIETFHGAENDDTGV